MPRVSRVRASVKSKATCDKDKMKRKVPILLDTRKNGGCLLCRRCLAWARLLRVTLLVTRFTWCSLLLNIIIFRLRMVRFLVVVSRTPWRLLSFLLLSRLPKTRTRLLMRTLLVLVVWLFLLRLMTRLRFRWLKPKKARMRRNINLLNILPCLCLVVTIILSMFVLRRTRLRVVIPLVLVKNMRITILLLITFLCRTVTVMIILNRWRLRKILPLRLFLILLIVRNCIWSLLSFILGRSLWIRLTSIIMLVMPRLFTLLLRLRVVSRCRIGKLRLKNIRSVIIFILRKVTRILRRLLLHRKLLRVMVIRIRMVFLITKEEFGLVLRTMLVALRRVRLMSTILKQIVLLLMIFLLVIMR